LKNIWYGDCQKAAKTQNNLEKNCWKKTGVNFSLLESVSRGGIGLDQLEEYYAGLMRDMARKIQVMMTAEARLATQRLTILSR